MSGYLKFRLQCIETAPGLMHWKLDGLIHSFRFGIGATWRPIGTYATASEAETVIQTLANYPRAASPLTEYDEHGHRIVEMW